MSEILFHERLGRGGYGEVYRATLRAEGAEERIVAVKLLNATVSRGSDAARRLRDEARLLAALRHRNILRIHDLVEIADQVALVTEYVPGEDLDRCVLDGMPPRALIEGLGQVAEALAVAWNAPSPDTGRPLHLVHRDIKPENLRVRPDGLIKILDFGVARAAELRREANTSTNTVLGSYRYMAPERFDAQVEPHPSMDMFALGCILYEGLTYRRLFEHLSMREMMLLSLPDTERYERFIAERLEELPDTTPARTIHLIHRLVHRDPRQRPSPEEMARLAFALAERLEGPNLLQWCTDRTWRRGTVEDGPWSGKAYAVTVRTDSLGPPDPMESFTPDPEPPTSDYLQLPDADDISDTELASPAPIHLPSRPSETSLEDATSNLDAALSTPSGPPARKRSTPTTSADPPAPSPTTPTEQVDLDALRRSIGLNPTRDSPSPVHRRKQHDQAVVAHLLTLGLLGILALFGIGIALGIALW